MPSRQLGSRPRPFLSQARLPSRAATVILPPATPPPAAGTLPFDLTSLASIDISVAGNRFGSTLPPTWESATLQTLDLSSNVLSGFLPASLGGKGTLPQLRTLSLQGNVFRGEHASMHRFPRLIVVPRGV